jgi:hypothetical protein
MDDWSQSYRCIGTINSTSVHNVYIKPAWASSASWNTRRIERGVGDEWIRDSSPLHIQHESISSFNCPPVSVDEFQGCGAKISPAEEGLSI